MNKTYLKTKVFAIVKIIHKSCFLAKAEDGNQPN